MTERNQKAAVGEIVTAMIVATDATPRSKPPRRSWRRVLIDISAGVESLCSGLFRYESSGLRGRVTKVHVNYWHPMALPFCCIVLAASPFLVAWAAMRPVLKWHGSRQSLRYSAEVLRKK